MADLPERGARAVIRVEPGHAVCYWQAISEVLQRRAGHAVRLEVSVLEPPAGTPAVQGSALIELEMRTRDVDQTALDCALEQARPVCVTAPGAHHAQQTERRPRANDDTVEAPIASPATETVASQASDTIAAPLGPRLQPTVQAPLITHAPAAEAIAVDRPPPEPPTAELQVAPPTATPQALPPAPSRKARAVEALQLVAILVAVVLGIRSVMQTFRVDGPSMEPNFETNQTLLVNKVAYWHIDGTPFEGLLPTRPQGAIAYLFGGPQRGDVVVFRPPGESSFEADLIKRVIGLPGDRVSIQAGQVFVNGQRLIEPYVAFPADYTYPDDDLAVLVPNDSYFVLGDNRPVSSDSHLGWLVPAEKLIGKAWLTYWPLQRLGFIQRGDARLA